MHPKSLYKVSLKDCIFVTTFLVEKALDVSWKYFCENRTKDYELYPENSSGQ